MKKLQIVIYLLFACSILVVSCKKEESQSVAEKTSIVLINPSLGYLQSFEYLINNKIIKIPGIQLHVVHYAKMDNASEAIKSYIQQNKLEHIQQSILDGDLAPDNLFMNNDLSASYKQILKTSDAILFLGGADFPAEIYHQKTSLLTSIQTPERHYFELSFLFHLFGGSQNSTFKPLLEDDPHFVVFGFCLGMQSMNAAAGGDMYQDIPYELYNCQYVEDVLDLDINSQHRNYWTNLSTDRSLNYHNFHQVKILDNPVFNQRFTLQAGETPTVCSSHHQAVKMIGKDFQIAATSLDGKVVEALQHGKYKNVIGTQFHPEFSSLYNPDLDKLKRAPADTIAYSEHEMLKLSKSLDFHLKFWKAFSELVISTKN